MFWLKDRAPSRSRRTGAQPALRTTRLVVVQFEDRNAPGSLLAYGAMDPGPIAATNAQFLVSDGGGPLVAAVRESTGKPVSDGDTSVPSGVSFLASETAMHVESIDIQRKDSFGRGADKNVVEAVVLITDQYGNPVSGAVVIGDWSGCFTKGGAFATTDSTGRAFILGKSVHCPPRTESCLVTFTVTNVSKEGVSYDPSSNVETSDSRLCG